MVKISLVMATYGRKDEVEQFLYSIVCSNYNLEYVEIIIVDQNEEDLLDRIIKKYMKKIKILHIKSEVKGLSLNRNIGIKYSKGSIIAFPDDDCKYISNTLSMVEEYFEKNRNVYALMGRILDEDGNDCIRKWPNKTIEINKNNFYTKVSSITLFKRNNKDFLFDENLGVGTYFGSNEDADIIYNLLDKNNKIIYNPKLVLYHPKPSKKLNLNKVESYGRGFGAFVRKNLDVHTFILSIKVFVYHTLNLIYGLITFNKYKLTYSYLSLKSRINGFYKFNSIRK